MFSFLVITFQDFLVAWNDAMTVWRLHPDNAFLPCTQYKPAVYKFYLLVSIYNFVLLWHDYKSKLRGTHICDLHNRIWRSLKLNSNMQMVLHYNYSTQYKQILTPLHGNGSASASFRNLVQWVWVEGKKKYGHTFFSEEWPYVKEIINKRVKRRSDSGLAILCF